MSGEAGLSEVGLSEPFHGEPDHGEPDHGEPGIHTLPPDLRAQIVDALCEVDRLSEEQGQTSLLSYLASSSAQRRVPTGSLMVFAERLVDHCVRRFALLDLSRWLHRWEDGSLQAERVVKLVRPLVEKEENETLSAQLFDAAGADLDEVRRQLTPVACEDMVRIAFRKARSRSAAPGRLPEPNNAWEALVCLSQFTAVKGEPPVRGLCKQLAKILPALPCAGLLRHWGSTSPPQFIWGDPELVHTPARLVVWVNPGARRDQVELESWAVLSQQSGGEPEFLEHWVDRVSRDRVADRLGDRLGQLAEDVRARNHSALRVEVIASVAQMCALRVELWQSQEVLGRERLGTRAELVYRAAEVADHRSGTAGNAWRHARKRWGSLERKGKACVLDLFHKGDISERLPPRRWNDERVICLSVPGGLERPVRHVHDALEGGVPVLVWHSGTQNGSVHDWLDPVRLKGEVTLTADQVHGLPATLLRSRTGKASDQDSVHIEDGFAVALMFHDDLPVRPPQTLRISPDSIR